MHSVRAAAGETGAVNNIGVPGLDGANRAG